MKVYSLPEELETTLPILSLNWKEYAAAEKEHAASVKAWLIDNGFTGLKTGHELLIPIADGHACYMFADARGTGSGQKSFLVHLPYGDAWHSRDVEFLPQSEVLKRLIDPAKREEMFA